MHWRRFRVAEIPIDDEKQFEVWIRNRWREKDYLLEYFTRTGRFPTDQNWMLKETHQKANGDAQRTKSKVVATNYIETQVKSNSWEEFLLIFAPVSAFVIVLFLFYNASTGNMPGGTGQGAPQEWSDVMNHAAALVNSASKLSEIQQAVNMSAEAADAEYAEDAASKLPIRPPIRSAKSTGSTAASSTSGAAKYKFVPANGAAKSGKVGNEPKKVIRLANGKIVPLSEAFGPKGLEDEKPSSTAQGPKEIQTASGIKLKLNPSGTKSSQTTPSKPAQVTTSSGLKLKTANTNKPAQTPVKKAPSAVSSVTSQPRIARPKTVPATNGLPRKAPLTAANLKVSQATKASSPDQKASPQHKGKKQLANGMWVNVDSPKSAASTAMNGAKTKAAEPKRLSNGVWIS